MVCASPFDDIGDACPDLVVVGPLTYSFSDSAVSLSVPVANDGAAESAQSEVTAEGKGVDARGSFPPLEPGDSSPVVLEAAIPDELRGQLQTLTVTLDPGNQISEENEQNNTALVELTYPAGAIAPTTSESTTTRSTDTEPTTTENGEPSSSDEGGGFMPFLLIAGGIVLAALVVLAVYSSVRRRTRVRRTTVSQRQAQYEEYREGPMPSAHEAMEDLGGSESDAETPDEPYPPSAAAPAASERPAVPRDGARYVSTGFAPAKSPATRLRPATPLRPGESYFFWLEVGVPVERSIEETPIELSEIDSLPPESRLTVVLFPLGEESEPSDAASEGELVLRSDGQVVVGLQPSSDVDLPKDSQLLRRRLFFPVHVQPGRDTLHFRCSIYHKQLLLQSRLVTARVSAHSKTLAHALRSSLDFTLAPRLDPSHVARLPEYRLSLLLNQTEGGTHSLTVKGEHFNDVATFDPLELQNLVTYARRSLRKAAWGSETPWHQGTSYRYQNPTTQKLRDDLVTLALCGRRVYVAVCHRLAGARSQKELEACMVTPGYVQLALKQSPRHLLPAALLYDYAGFSDTAERSKYDLCPEFSAFVDDDRPLEEAKCFQGMCPSRGKETIVCPSGFWGYRHALGIPVTLMDAADVPPNLTYSGSPSLAVAVCTDPSFKLRQAHEKVLRELRPDLNYAATRADALLLLKTADADIVYFYCHGGMGDVPYIKVGPLSEEAITATTLFNEEIRWDKPRPLVFLNGCHTTGLEPEQALEFVSALVGGSQAAGVVGTEITVFEPLARDFAEDCLRRFLSGAPLGWAVRDARLALLKAKNPLGLVYLPYAIPSLQLVLSS